MTRAARRLREPVGLAVAAVALPWRAAPLLTVGVIAATVVSGVAPAAGAWLTKAMLDAVAADSASAGHVVWLALGLAALGAVAVATLYATGHAVNVLRQRVAVAVASALFERVAGFPGLRYVESPAFRDELRLAEQGAEEVPGVLIGFGQDVLRSTVVLASLTGVVVALWPPAAALLAASAAASLAVHVVTGRRQAGAAVATASAYRRRLFYRDLLTDVRAAKEIRLFGLAPLLHDRMVGSFRAATRAELAAERRAVTAQSLMSLAVSGVNAIGLVAVAGLVSAGRASVGDLALFLAAQAGVQGALTGVVVQSGEAARVLALFARYRAVVARPGDLAAGTTIAPPLRHGIELRDVWFRYDAAQPWVLRGASLVIPAGATVGLVGANGAGKSTLVKLLCRFYDPDHGEVLWDGVPLREFDIASLRRRMSVTFQDFMTYDLTAAENIGLGRPERLADADQIEAAARLAEVHETITALPQQYATVLSRAFHGDDGEAGVTLSGGQWQRVAIARALMRADSDVCLLDEPTAGLDADAEHRVHRVLRDHATARTNVLVSHRLSTMRDADSIVLLAGGRVAEAGTHAELMARDGRYARLFRLQARGYADAAIGTATP